MAKLNWYVVRAVSGQEKKAKMFLEKEVQRSGLEKFIVEILTPTQKVFRVRKLKDGKTKKIAVEQIFFPGYVFVQADVTHGEVMPLIKSIPGVIGFLGDDAKKPEELPKPMRQSEIDRVLGRMADEPVSEDSSISVSYAIKDQVRIIEGAFADFIGEVHEVDEKNKKLNVMVSIFGRNTPIDLKFVQVEKV